MIAGLAVVAPGCRDEGPLALDELDEPVLTVSWYYGTLEQPELPHFYVQVSPRHPLDECPAVVPELTAFVDAQELSVLSRGGYTTIEGRKYCTVPTFELPGELVNAHPFAETTVIELSDGASAFGAVARHLFAERSVALAEPVSGELEAGQRAVLAWTPSSDELGLSAVLFYPDGAEGSDDDDVMPSFVLSGPDLEIDGDQLAFFVPAVEPQSGVLRVEVSAAVSTDECRGFWRCEVGVLATSEVAAQVR
jgi:hypothetical protein